jgi:tungstate transport system ATP-binding protein
MNIYMKNGYKEYGGRTVLDIDRLRFEGGHVYAVLGPNGSGKSTLLECTAGVNSLTSGTVLYDDAPYSEEVRQKVSIMAQKPYLFNTSAWRNIETGLLFRGMDKAEVKSRLEKYLSYFGISHLLDKNARRLSGGEGAKVALLRTAVLETEVTFLDEPTASMDIEGTMKAEKLIRDMAGEGRTVVMVTHDLYQAGRVADYVIFMDSGRAIEAGSKNKVLNNPQHRLVKLMLNM